MAQLDMDRKQIATARPVWMHWEVVGQRVVTTKVRWRMGVLESFDGHASLYRKSYKTVCVMSIST